MQELRHQHLQGVLSATDLRLDQAIEYWLLSQKHAVEPNTHLRYGLELGMVANYLGRFKVRELVSIHITQMFQKMEADGFSADARRRAAARLRQLLKALMPMGYVAKNVAKDVPLPKVQKEEIHPLSEEQAAHLLRESVGDTWHALYWLALNSGARQGELWAVTRADLNLDKRTVLFNKSLEEKQGHHRIKEATTTASRRTLEILPPTCRALADHLKKHDADLVFCDSDGKHLRKSNWARNYWYPLLERLGLDIRFHDLRHTTATLLLSRGSDVISVARRLGHADTTMVLQTYGHLVPRMIQRDMHNLAEALKEGCEAGGSIMAVQGKET